MATTKNKVAIGDICEFIRGLTYSKDSESEYPTGNVVLRANNINRDTSKLDLADLKYLKDGFVFTEEKRLRKNDIFICTSSGSKSHVGKVALIRENSPYFFGGFMGAVRCTSDRILPEFLFLILKSGDFRKHISSIIAGANINNLRGEDVLAYKINLPALDVQKNALEKTGLIDLVKEKRVEADRLGSNFASALFHKMFGDPHKHTRGWQSKKISELGELFTGATPSTKSSEYWNGSINWVTPAEISDDTFIINHSQRQITELGYQNCSAKLFPAGTVILSTRAPIGKVAIAGVEMCSNQGIKSIYPRPDLIDAVYLYWWLKQSTQLLNSLGGGATFKELSTPSLKAVNVPVPPLALQREFSDRVRESQKLKATQARSGELINEVFQALTAELV